MYRLLKGAICIAINCNLVIGALHVSFNEEHIETHTPMHFVKFLINKKLYPNYKAVPFLRTLKTWPLALREDIAFCSTQKSFFATMWLNIND